MHRPPELAAILSRNAYFYFDAIQWGRIYRAFAAGFDEGGGPNPSASRYPARIALTQVWARTARGYEDTPISLHLFEMGRFLGFTHFLISLAGNVVLQQFEASTHVGTPNTISV